MIINDSEIRPSVTTKQSVSSELYESVMQKNVDTVINNWLSLQKIVKENQTLQKVIQKQHNDNMEQLKKNYFSLFNLKIESKMIYEDIKNLKMKLEGTDIVNENNKEYFLSEISGDYFGMAQPALEKILNCVRNDYNYIPILVSLIDEKDTKEDIESLAEFLCNQFYNNILIPNPEQEELLICIYKLLEQEIKKTDILDFDLFLDDSTFMGKFMTVFSKQQEINNFMANLSNKVLNEVFKKTYAFMDISLNNIKKNIMKNEELKKEKEKKKDNKINELGYSRYLKNKANKDNNVSITKILENIPKSKINFKKHLELEMLLENESFNNEIFSIYNEEEEFEEDEDPTKKFPDYNRDYKTNLTEDILHKKLKEESDPDCILLYKYLIKQLNQLYNDSNAFGNDGFFKILSLNYFKQEKDKMIKVYLRNFYFIQEQIDDIIQSLIDKITTIPYTARCICKMIDILIYRKFPLLPKYFRHSFIGKFLFNKCLFPILSLENTNGLKNIIFSKSQINCINCIISVLSKANQAKLFDYYNDIEKTMFNYYLLEIIPKLNQFYDKLVDIAFPNFCKKIVDSSSEKYECNEFLFNSRKNQETPNAIDKPKLELDDKLYDYFRENPDELITLKSFYFNMKDILFIYELLSRNIKAFKNLSSFSKFENGMNHIQTKNDLDYIIYEQKNLREKRQKANKNNNDNKQNDINKEPYFVFFDKDENEELKKFLEIKKEEKSLLARIKNSIKTILRRLNLLNLKEYSYLNFATTNEKFFIVLHYLLKDYEETDNEVPLSWHSKFIYNNKNQLEQNYTINDYEKLYDEIYQEEIKLLNIMKSFSPIINMREGMNINCSENAIRNLKLYNRSLLKAKKLEKIKIFIAKDTTEVCINLSTSKDIILRTKSLAKEKCQNKDNAKDIGQFVRIISTENCIHISDKFMQKSQGKNLEKLNSHAKSIGDFINKFRNPEGAVIEALLKYIKEDIEKGKRIHQIYIIFEDYEELLQENLIKNFNYLIENNNVQEFMGKVEDYILERIYNYVFPIIPIPDDISFCEITKSYDWINAENLGVKCNLPPEAIKDSISYILQIEERAHSVYEKLKCFEEIYKNIDNITDFYYGKLDNSVEGRTPIFTYILLKAHPKRFISNINYITCFTSDKNINKGNLKLSMNKQTFSEAVINNSTVSINTIMNITPKSVNMSVDEFNQKIAENKRRVTSYI